MDLPMPMKLRHLICAALLFSAAFTTAAATVAAPNIGAPMLGLVELLSDTRTEEYAKARTVHQIQNSARWVLVFFTLEGIRGSNSYSFYLAVFEPDYGVEAEEIGVVDQAALPVKKYRLLGYATVGGKGWRHVDFSNVKVTGDLIVLQTTEYKPSDPMSTPSLPGQAIFQVEFDRLIELPAGDAQAVR
jgi:hypothetical protein